METSISGRRVTLERFVDLKAASPMLVTLSGITTSERFSQPAKASFPMVSIPSDRLIFLSADDPQLLSNALLPMLFTLPGMVISGKLPQEANA